MNNGLLTTSELKEKLTVLTDNFEKEKKYIYESSIRMGKLKEEYDEIVNLINKREGKNV